MSPGPEQAALLFERAGAHVALVTINRPAARNAVSGAVAQGMEAAVQESLQVARRAAELEGAELRRLSEEARTRVMQTEDYPGGPRAFVEKRPPIWRGR